MRVKRRPTLRRPTDEEIRRNLAAQLVGMRIALGLTPAEMMSKIGYRYEDAPRKEKRGLNEQRWAVYRLALLENGLADDEDEDVYVGRLSTLQRYTRALGIGARIDVKLYGPETFRKIARRRLRHLARRKHKRMRPRRRVGL